MHPVLAPAFLHALRILLPLFACGWDPAFASPVWWKTNDVVHLYTADQYRSFHLQINPNGYVDGTQNPTVYSAVVRKTINLKGHISIIGVKTRVFLCMYSNGNLFGTPSFSNNDCVFKHILFETSYDVYESVRYKFLVSLGKVKGILGPNKRLPRFSQFLTRRNEIPLSQFYTPLPQPQPEVTMDNGEDPCGGILDGRIPEEVPLVNGIHPCFIEDDDRQPNDGIVRRRIPSPRTG